MARIPASFSTCATAKIPWKPRSRSPRKRLRSSSINRSPRSSSAAARTPASRPLGGKRSSEPHELRTGSLPSRSGASGDHRKGRGAGRATVPRILNRHDPESEHASRLRSSCRTWALFTALRPGGVDRTKKADTSKQCRRAHGRHLKSQMLEGC